MGSLVSVNTYTHSVTYVTDQMLRSLKLIITLTGLDPAKFVSDWDSCDLAIRTWLTSRHLRELYLEIKDANGNFVTRCDFIIDYTYGSGEGSMWVDTEAIRYSIVKLGKIPSQCTYDIFLKNEPGRPDVPGWGPASLLSTEGFVKQSLGTTIGTHELGAQAAYWRKA